MFSIFKRKKQQPAPPLKPWQGSKRQLIDWLESEELTEDELTEYIKTFEKEKPTVHDYTKAYYGHAYSPGKTHGSGIIHSGMIFYSKMLLSKKTFELGDLIQLKTKNGMRHYMLLCIVGSKNPSDLYHIHIVGIEWPEKKEY